MQIRLYMHIVNNSFVRVRYVCTPPRFTFFYNSKIQNGDLEVYNVYRYKYIHLKHNKKKSFTYSFQTTFNLLSRMFYCFGFNVSPRLLRLCSIQNGPANM